MDAVSFAERRPMDAQTVVVFCDEWSAPKVMIYRANWDGHGSPRLVCDDDGRHYWHPTRMTWLPRFELVTQTSGPDKAREDGNNA